MKSEQELKVILERLEKKVDFLFKEWHLSDDPIELKEIEIETQIVTSNISLLKEILEIK